MRTTDEGAAERSLFLRRHWHSNKGGKQSRRAKRARSADSGGQSAADSCASGGVLQPQADAPACPSVCPDSSDGRQRGRSVEDGANHSAHRRGCGTWLQDFFYEADAGRKSRHSAQEQEAVVWTWKRSCPGGVDLMQASQVHEWHQEEEQDRGSKSDSQTGVCAEEDVGYAQEAAEWCECTGINKFDKVRRRGNRS